MANRIIPAQRVKGNKKIGYANENEIAVNFAQDIIDMIANGKYEKAKQANAFVLTPLQDHVPSFILAVSSQILIMFSASCCEFKSLVLDWRLRHFVLSMLFISLSRRYLSFLRVFGFFLLSALNPITTG